ncbi:MAG: mannose-1-phosphate guanylyltransferase, partial [Spirochaetaceae bacterium]|nr:mannose-1-phosphate guanylyltransferase [Spirochaetaceae bacterium]
PEPAAKNTAPAVACGLYYTDFRYRERRTMLVLTSDHLITPLETFRQDAETAAAAAREGSLVVFGIPPRGPETGYGYIEIESAESRTAPLCPVASFREKPDKAAAQGFLDTGRFYWNSGMFAFSTHALKDAFRACAPDIARLFETLAPPTFAEYREGTETAHPWPALREAYTRVTGISFDYAVAEKLAARGRGMVMARARFDWRDVGCWDEYAAVLGDAGSSAEVYESGSASCFVDSPVPVALCGVEDLIVAVSPGENGGAGAVLVAKKGETQKVRDIVERIKLAGRTKLL